MQLRLTTWRHGMQRTEYPRVGCLTEARSADRRTKGERSESIHPLATTLQLLCLQINSLICRYLRNPFL